MEFLSLSSVIGIRDTVFLSKFWQGLFQLQGTTLKMSSSYHHPQTDGQTEVNKRLEQNLRCYISEDPHQWHKYLGLTEWYTIPLIIFLWARLLLKLFMVDLHHHWLITSQELPKWR